MIENGYSLQARGMLEAENPKIEPLPPTPMTAEAAEILAGWGLSEDTLRRLRELTSSFRYDLPVEKVTRLASEGGYIGSDSEGNPLMILPYFYDIKARFDGQCGDIGTQWIQYMYSSSLLTDMNDELTDGSRIVVCYAHGQADTHFVSEGASHTWNCLAKQNSQGDVEEFVVVDAAFQRIFADNRYTFRNVVIDVREFQKLTSHASVQIGSLEANDFGNWDMAMGEVLTLGVSQDRKYSYGLSFLACDQTNSYAMVVTRTEADGSYANFLYDPLSKKLMASIPQNALQPEEEQEIRQMLTAAQAFTYIDANTDADVMPPGSMMPYTVKFNG